MVGKPKIYVETTVISYLTAWPSAEVVTAAHQAITQEWWNSGRSNCDLFVSELVREEASAGDEDAAARRLEVIDSLTLISFGEQTRQLADVLAVHLKLPNRALADAAHIALAVTNGMDYLVTWNCRHIANARLRTMIEDVVAAEGYIAPVICTPEELLEDFEI
jgi:predicted nucleic acid-binding protein